MRKFSVYFSPLALLCGFLLSLTASAQTAILQGDERQQYIASLKQLHAVASEREALLAQINSLLKEHALLAGYQVGHDNPRDIVYSLSIQNPGELTISEQVVELNTGLVQGRTASFSIYGKGYTFKHDCFADKLSCTVSHGDSSSVLLRIVRRPQVAQELSQALSYLLRDMQRGG